MTQITITLEQLEKFLSRLNPNYEIRRLALIDCEKVLTNVFEQDVMSQDHNNVFQIESKEELKRLVKTHATPRHAKPYNEDYLKRKFKLGEFSPHKFMNYGFWMGTDINYESGRVVMKTKPIIQRGFNYLDYHETQRSVLKITFFKAWQKLIDIILARYCMEAQK